MGRALDWVSAVWDNDPPVGNVFFQSGFLKVFEYLVWGHVVSMKLPELHQGSDPVTDYTVKFHTLEALSGWNDLELVAVFHKGLKPKLQAEMAFRQSHTMLLDYIHTAIHLDNLLHQQHDRPNSKLEPQLVRAAICPKVEKRSPCN